jgi:hypothetical protein
VTTAGADVIAFGQLPSVKQLVPELCDVQSMLDRHTTVLAKIGQPSRRTSAPTSYVQTRQLSSSKGRSPGWPPRKSSPDRFLPSQDLWRTTAWTRSRSTSKSSSVRPLLLSSSDPKVRDRGHAIYPRRSKRRCAALTISPSYGSTSTVSRPRRSSKRTRKSLRSAPATRRTARRSRAPRRRRRWSRGASRSWKRSPSGA